MNQVWKLAFHRSKKKEIILDRKILTFTYDESEFWSIAAAFSQRNRACISLKLRTSDIRLIEESATYVKSWVTIFWKSSLQYQYRVKVDKPCCTNISVKITVWRKMWCHLSLMRFFTPSHGKYLNFSSNIKNDSYLVKQAPNLHLK